MDAGRHRRTAALLLAAGLSLAPAARVVGAETPGPVTRPMTLDHGRVIVNVEFIRPDGGTRPARVWVDTGGGDLLVGRDLARDLGLAHPTWPDSGAFTLVEATSPTPAMRFGTVALDSDGLATRIRDGAAVLPGVPAEACLPARALRHLCVVFDYPARRLTMARPGALAPRGTAVPCRVNPETGLPMVTAILEGAGVPLGLDTGSAGTWLSDSLTGAWLARHPEWPHAVGAAGSANFFGFPFEPTGALLCLPRVGIAGLAADEVGVLGLDAGFFRWYSRKSADPVAGFLGANVLTRFRLTVDFERQMTWWQGGSAPRARDLDIVGLTLRPGAQGGYAVAGVVTRDGRSVVEGVQVGDRLLRVDGLDVAEATMGAVVGALRGRPGSSHRLVLQRGDEWLTVPATVTRLP